MKSAVELVKRAFLKHIRPLRKQSVSEWADSYRMLSSGLTAEPGRWKSSRAPYQKEPMDAFSQPGIKQVVVMSASQVGKSAIMENVIGRFAHLDPCTIMMIQPSLEMAQDFSKTRISPMIRDTKVLSDIFTDGEASKTRNGTNTILSKIFPGGRLIMCGANSPAGLASRPIRILLADEVDRFPESAGGEGNPVDLASKRMTTFWNSVMGLFSTPTTVGKTGGIESKYLLGTQEEWQHECPNCKTYSLLKWQDMVIDYESIEDSKGKSSYLIKSTQWKCPSCGHFFNESEMKKATQKYVALNPKAIENGIRSFHVNCFASPWLLWNDIALEWFEAKGDPLKEQVVVNTRFAESYEPAIANLEDTEYLANRETYNAELPDGVLLLTAAVDTQDNRFEYEICGWGQNEECWGIKKGVIMGQPDNLQTYKLLDAVLDKEYSFSNGMRLKIARTFLDSGGHYTGYIYEYCRLNFHKQRIPIKGQGGPGIPLNYKITKPKNVSIPLVYLGVDDGKQQIMNRLSLEIGSPFSFHFPRNEEAGYDQAYFKGLLSERKKVVKKNGTLKTIWEPLSQHIRNEPLDLRVYNLACMKSLNADWDKLKEAIHGGIPAKTKETRNVKIKPFKQRQNSSADTDFW